MICVCVCVRVLTLLEKKLVCVCLYFSSCIYWKAEEHLE